jgi:excisionase family DNA binding protein
MVPPRTGQPPDSKALADIELSLLTVEDAARQLSLSRTTIYALLKGGQITSVRIGRRRRIPATALTTYTNRLIAQQTDL